ncbi:IS21-like element helper ATPase IstB [Streptomyces sasae]|uniref:IS21-like element helper ATPase IstB n=1 Tax=Streptomyces sasae TaxID=1266772 RepID=UPI00292CF449|nr:IS21-like element helper ATPase IstB [Streptomyces sasae]
MMPRTAATADTDNDRAATGSGRRTGSQTAADLAFLARAMKAPSLLDAADRLAERARKESWTHAEYLVACLQREVSARESHGGEARVRAAKFPAVKTIEELDVTHLRGMTRQQLAHLGTLDFIAGKENAVFLGPPGTGKTHLAIGLAVRACQAGHRVAFATAAEWVDRLAAAHAAGRLAEELTRLGRYPLIVVDEVGYIPFEAKAANLFFQLVSNRYERASVIVTSNKPFGKAHMFRRTCARQRRNRAGSRLVVNRPVHGVVGREYSIPAEHVDMELCPS